MNKIIPVDARFEFKFIEQSTQLSGLDSWIAKHSAGFTTAYPPRFINNVYFDSWNYQAYWNNASGQSDRTKVRFRWYGDLLNPQSGTLEVKRRLNQMGWKELYKIDAPVFGREDELDKPLRWGAIRREIRNHLPGNGRKWFDAFPRPILINQYRRSYWQSRDQKVRLTVDSQERVFDQRFGARPNWTRAANLPEIVIVEIKCAREDRKLGAEIASSCPVRASRHSKYVKGLLASAHTTSSARANFF